MGEMSIQNTTNPQVVPAPVKKEDTEYTKRMKKNYGFFGPVTLLYAVFYAFCMFQNGSGVTFPFFMAGSLLYLCFCLSKLEISLRKNSLFYMVSMMLLAVSTFGTDDGRIIAFNKTGIFLLMMSLLLHQFYDTSKWRLGKYICSICELIFCCPGELLRPFADGRAHYKEQGSKNRTLLYALLGGVIAIPVLTVVVALLASADAVFRDVTNTLFENINVSNIFNVLFRVGFIFFASYLLVAYLCKQVIREEVKDRRHGEPILAITVTALLSVVYLMFSVIQIVYLFLGQMQLPEGYTYAMYAREGFFQLLTVSALNLVIVLVALSYFKESKILKVILTIMSLCTFIMIASSALRMIIYIRYYYLTFLRIFVLWALVLLFVLFVGIIIQIFKEDFPLFRYSMVVVTVLYILLSFSHPDYIIAKVNLDNASAEGLLDREVDEDDFFQAERYYGDYWYLAGLSADAAPAIVPFLEELGYELDVFFSEDIYEAVEEAEGFFGRGQLHGFGYTYLQRMQERCKNFGWRTFNVSRYFAIKQIGD